LAAKDAELSSESSRHQDLQRQLKSAHDEIAAKDQRLADTGKEEEEEEEDDDGEEVDKCDLGDSSALVVSF
jgi:hypothetical protein